MTSQNEAGIEEVLPDDAVAAFLEQHPDFFNRHPELSERIRVPHECGDAVSLISYQIQLLREQNRRLGKRLDDLVQVARDNDRLADRLHRLTLDLMDSEDLDAVLHTLKEGLRRHFDADMVAVRLLDADNQHKAHEDFVAADHDALDHFQRVLGDERPVCGKLPAEQAAFLFGDSARKVASAALIPISDQHVMGMLAIGSYTPDRFHPSQGTVFLRQLGQVAGRALRPHLVTP
ncbi:MAG: DUF484 family protein [Aquisalimonadaceae bacterium]